MLKPGTCQIKQVANFVTFWANHVFSKRTNSATDKAVEVFSIFEAQFLQRA